MKHLSILGSTGSIGKNTLKVARHLGCQVIGLAAHSNIDLLEKQALECRPQCVAVFDEAKALELEPRLPQIEVLAGLEGLISVATLSKADLVVSSIVGIKGIIPTLKAIEIGKTVGLANKEALVVAGELIMGAVKQSGAKILPIDSEHQAIFQCLGEESVAKVRRVILTASGGPFYAASLEEFQKVTPASALSHPVWRMGQKVTIDSSTLMNKGLEVIEAHFLFDLPLEKIEVVIHPQSVIHSFVEWIDGSLLCQVAEPDMKIPIQSVLTYPEKREGMGLWFDFLRHSNLELIPPDFQKFPCLNLAYEAGRQKGSLPCFMNAVNEVLVEAFLKGEIHWLDIPKHLNTLMDGHQVIPQESLETLFEVDREARKMAHLSLNNY